MTTRGMRLRLGLFVLLAAGLMALLIVMFGSLPSLFRRSTTYIVRFTDAPGLAVDAPVRRSGVRIGTVRDITLDEERGIVEVKIAVNAPYQIRRNEQATLVAGLLGSDVSIDFVPREPDEKEPLDRTPVEPGAVLIGIRAASVNTLLKGASEVVPSTQQTLNEIRKSIQRLEKLANRAEKTIPQVEDTLKVYRDLGTDVRKLVPEVQKTNASLDRLARSAQEVVPEVQRTSEEYRALATDVRKAIPELLKTNREIGDTARTAREMAPSIERTLDEYRGLARDARALVPVVRNNLEDAGAAARNVSRLAERADVMLQGNRERIEQSLDNLNKTLAGSSRLLNDDNVRNASTTITNISEASKQFPSISRNADETFRQAPITLRRLMESLGRADTALTDLGRLTRPLGERSERISRNADEALVQLNQILGDVRALMRTVDRSDGTLRKFLTDPSLYNNADAAAAMVMKLIPRLDRILKDFETFADKLARHPELLGVRGAVSGSDGLKNPPTPPLPPAGLHVPAPVQVFSPPR
jgi:ABC-type transporter Mla subunit MlaD